ncbi:MAG: Ig-like domain-containing protein [Planctomycetota bacterium]
MAACSSGGGTTATLPGTGGDFFVFATDPQPEAQIFLNDSVSIVFTKDVDVATANFNSVAFSVFDLNGNGLQEQPRGTFEVLSTTGPDANLRVLRFNPTFPDNDDYSNGGFKPGRRYLMQLAQGDARQGATLRDTSGKGLREPFTLSFQTVDGDTPSQLFRDIEVDGPQVVSAEVTPSENGVALLGKRHERPCEVRVQFNQPVNPASTNIPTQLDPNPALINPRQVTAAQKGRVFLEYDDVEYGQNAWIPATVDLEANSNGGSTLVLTPAGVLPNNATVRLIVESTLEDLSGESNRNNADHRRVAFSFQTEAARGPQFDAIVETFEDHDLIDLEPTFLEPLAEVGVGYVRAGFEFEGVETQFDYRPAVSEVLLNTDFTQITPDNGAPFNVSGGVFQFRNVTIPVGVKVRGTGSKPMVWLVTGDFVVEGEISVEGGNGARVDTLNSANFPTAGGISSCGGGNGGRGSPSTNDTSNQGETGFGAFQVAGLGGPGGRHSCTVSACTRGGGGGGGSFSTKGDPHYILNWLVNPPAMPQTGFGQGGRMCGGIPPSGPQVDAGPLAFLDLRRDNDFWGSGIRLAAPRQRVTGELLAPRGGTGGGGGGDSGSRCSPNPGFITDTKGGGGGAGGGILIIKALGRIVVKSTGLVNANGGYGGGGEQAGTNGAAGGGGGGSGGMIVLMSGSGIHIVAHGSAYADAVISSNTNRAYDFCIQADGGTGTRGPFQGNQVSGKYPAKGGPTSRTTWDANPIGGFGGLGLIQLMAPPGDNLPAGPLGGDGTNTRLDDSVFFYADDDKLAEGLEPGTNPHRENGPAITGGNKQRLLGWRGFAPNENYIGIDDEGNEVVLLPNVHAEGDMRPSPVLLPAPFGAVSRARSRWIDTGASVRRVDTAGNDPGARTMVERIDTSDPTNPFTSLKAGPTYLFAGTFAGASDTRPGYVAYDQSPTGVVRSIPEVLPAPVAIASVADGASWRGVPAYLITLRDSSAVLGQIPGRYTGYRARMANALGTVLGSYRILGHDDKQIYLSTDAGFLPEEPAASVQVVADLIDFRTTEGEGFGETFIENGNNVPNANARIGFAFHVNPKAAVAGNDPNRIPEDSNEFLHELDLQRPDVMRRVRELGKQMSPMGGAVAVQYDILFNASFTEAAGNVDANRSLSPAAARPEIRQLVIPYQF